MIALLTLSITATCLGSTPQLQKYAEPFAPTRLGTRLRYGIEGAHPAAITTQEVTQVKETKDGKLVSITMVGPMAKRILETIFLTNSKGYILSNVATLS